MARGDFNCPLCGAVLGLLSPSVKPGIDIQKSTELGNHVHVMVTGLLKCSNNHEFEASGDFILTRIG